MDDEETAQLIADAEQQVRDSGATARRLMTALERERFNGPVRGAHDAGERAYALARRAAEQAGVPAHEAAARGKLAFWVAYFTDLAEEAAARAAVAREDERTYKP